MSTARDIANLFAARAAEIRQSGGYLTDIGAKVFRGKAKITPDMMPCVVLVESDDKVIQQTKGVRQREAKLSQPYVFVGNVACDPDNPNDAAHDVIADLKKAIFGHKYDPRVVIEVRYVGKTIQPREDGTAFVAAGVEIEVDFVESLDNP